MTRSVRTAVIPAGPPLQPVAECVSPEPGYDPLIGAIKDDLDWG
jgi:hypothetical protein